MFAIALLSKGGSDLLNEFQSTVDSLESRADDRNRVVSERIAALEEELADLRQLRRQLEAAKTA